MMHIKGHLLSIWVHSFLIWKATYMIVRDSLVLLQCTILDTFFHDSSLENCDWTFVMAWFILLIGSSTCYLCWICVICSLTGTLLFSCKHLRTEQLVLLWTLIQSVKRWMVFFNYCHCLYISDGYPYSSNSFCHIMYLV